MRFLLSFALCLSLYQAFAQADTAAISRLLTDRSAVFAGNRGSGVFVQIEQAGKGIVYTHSGGVLADQPMPIASASKWLSALVVLRLADQGKLQLNDPVSRYLPAFDRPDKRTITIAQCFSHTSGLAGNAGGEEGNAFTKMGGTIGSLQAQADTIANTALRSQPGTAFAYGGGSMQVVGALCERATGKSWAQLFQQEVVAPLGLTNTYFLGQRQGRAPRIAGGAVSTANDYLKVMRMVAAGGKVAGKTYLSPTTFQTMLADQTVGTTVAFSPFSKYEKRMEGLTTPGYGMGHWIMVHNGEKIHSSPGAFGFTPWFNASTGEIGVLATQSAFQRIMPVWWQMLGML